MLERLLRERSYPNRPPPRVRSDRTNYGSPDEERRALELIWQNGWWHDLLKKDDEDDE